MDITLTVFIGLAALGFFLVSQMPKSKSAKIGTSLVLVALLLRIIILLAEMLTRK